MRFEQVPARAQDLAQLIRWQVRKAAPFPIEEAQVSLRARARVRRRPGVHRSPSPGATIVAEYEGLLRRRRRPRRHRRPVDVQCRQRGARERGAPATGDWLLVNVGARLRVDCHPPRPADHLLPEPRSGRRRDARRSRPPDGDVLRGSPAGRRLQPRVPCGSAVDCQATMSSSAAASKQRLGLDVEARRYPDRGGAHRSHHARRPRCSTRSRRSSDCCCAAGRRQRDSRTTWRPARSTTSRRSTSGCSSRRCVVAVATLFNVVQMLRYSQERHGAGHAGRERRSAGDGAPRRRGTAPGAPSMRNRLNARRSRRVRPTS